MDANRVLLYVLGVPLALLVLYVLLHELRSFLINRWYRWHVNRLLKKSGLKERV